MPSLVGSANGLSRFDRRFFKSLTHLGIVLDEQRNEVGLAERLISAEGSPAEAYIVMTDEEAIVARAVTEYLETEG